VLLNHVERRKIMEAVDTRKQGCMAICNPANIDREGRISIRLSIHIDNLRYTSVLKISLDQTPVAGQGYSKDVMQYVEYIIKQKYPSVRDICFKLEKWVSL
jgi:hypothetical protein